MRDCYTLGEVARILNRTPAQVVYPLVTRKIDEPEVRVAGKRLFRTEDVTRLARHFGISPNWTVLNATPVDVDADPPVRLTLRPPYEVSQVGETSCEIKDSDGVVIAWTSDRAHALVLAGLLEAAARG